MFRPALLLLTVLAPPQNKLKAVKPATADSSARSALARCLDGLHVRATPLRSPTGERVFIEGAKAVLVGKNLMLLGYPTLVSEASRRDDTASPGMIYLGVRLIGNAAGAPIPLPERTGAYRLLRVAPTPTGVIDALWRSDGPVDSLLSRDSLRSASWSGTSWSAPRIVPGFGHAALWSPLRVSQPARSVDGPWLRAADKIVRWTWHGWQVHSVADQAELYFDVLSLRGGVDLLTYVANASPGGNTVFLKRSTDRGRTWSAGQRVGPAVSDPAYEPHLLALDTQRVALVWIEGSQPLIGQTLRLALSRDAGRTWNQQASYRLPQSARTLSTAVDSLGTIHVVTQLAMDATSSFTVPYHAVWRATWSGAWLAQKSATAFGVATIDAVGPRSVLMTWSEFEGQAQASMPVTKVIIGDAACFARAGRIP